MPDETGAGLSSRLLTATLAVFELFIKFEHIINDLKREGPRRFFIRSFVLSPAEIKTDRMVLSRGFSIDKRVTFL